MGQGKPLKRADCFIEAIRAPDAVTRGDEWRWAVKISVVTGEPSIVLATGVANNFEASLVAADKWLDDNLAE